MALHRTMTYYGEEENDDDLPTTWYHYLVIASPGPKAGSGVASIITLSQARAQAIAQGPSHTIFAKEGGPADRTRQGRGVPGSPPSGAQEDHQRW